MQKLAQLCIKRPVFATMLVMFLVVMGLDAYRKLGVDFFPKIEFPIVTVTTTLRGAAPEEVETQVTKRIEEAVNTISGIDDLNSTSAEGISICAIQFMLDKDPDVAAQEVRDKIATITRDLPKDVDPPVVEKLATDASPVINVVISSKRDLRETTKLVDDEIKKNIESLSGVGQVRFVGERRRQIQVWLDGEKLYSYNLNVDQIRSALAAQNVEVPGGRIDQGQRELSLRTLGRLENPKDFARIIVGTVGGSPVRISDIGRVEDGVEEPRSLARLNGEPAVVLEVRKQAGTNTLDVIKNIKSRISALQKSLPPDLEITYTRDQSTFIEESFKAVQEHLLLGGLLAAVIVLLFIRNWRSTLIAAVAIPTSIISTYSLMNWMGFTLNQMTMLALTLVVGIVIDDAIVVLENVFRFMEEKKLPPVEAAIKGTADIGLAVLATTLSLVIIFLPVAMMSGIVGKFMSSFGYTAAFAIMVSLVVSFTLTPMLCSRFLSVGTGNGGSHGTKETWLFRVTSVPYRAMLYWSMSHRWLIGAICILVMLSIAPLFMIIGKDFVPFDDQSEFEVIVRAPVGSSLEGTESVVKQLEQDIRTLPGVKDVLTTLGADQRRQVDRGSILVELVPVERRRLGQKEIMLMARERMLKYRDLITAVQPPSMIQGGGSNVDLQFSLQGPDLNLLDGYAQRLKKKLSEVPGVTDLDTSYESGKPELRVTINRDKAADLNVSVASVATALRTLVGGDQQATTYREGDDRYDVQLRVEKRFRDSPAALDRLYVPSATLGNVPVSNVAQLKESTGPMQIERYNRQRRIMLTANLVKGQSMSNVIAILNKETADLNMPPQYRGGLIGKSKEFGRAAANFVIAFLLSILLMYMVLAAQFESFVDPITILISLPLSVPFALLSLLIMRENFSIIYTSVGVLVLFGIVKKNSILQVDHIKALRREGMPRLEAIMLGCEDRLRPILMTTAALVAGMLPLALGGGAGAGSRRTVAIVVIGGQSLCLILTLLVTPVAYSFFDDLANSPRWRKIASMFSRLRPKRVLSGVTGMFLLFVVVFLPSAAVAQTPVQDTAAPLLEPSRVGVSITQARLTLQQAVDLALKNNLEIEIERTNVANAAEALKAAKGVFDPNFRLQPGISSVNTPAASVLQGAGGKLAEHTFSTNAYFRQRLPWYGASFNVDWENSRYSTSNAFASLNPLRSSRLTIGITAPLLRNRVIDFQRGDIRIRNKQRDIADKDFELRVIDVASRVETAYWNLAAARQDATVQGEGVKLAKEQLERNQRMIAAGTLAPIEQAASEAEYQRRLDTWYASVSVVTEAENGLKTLLAPDRKDPLWSDEIIPAEVKFAEPAALGDLNELSARALKQRPELMQLVLRRDVVEVQKQVAADQVRPQVNLVAAYWNSGIGGDVSSAENPFSGVFADQYQRINELSAIANIAPLVPPSFGAIPANLIGGYGSALSNLFAGRYQSVQVGIAFDITPRNRTAQANLAQTAIAERRLKLEESRLEVAIEAQVRNALQAIQSTRQRIVAAGASERAAQEKLDSEIRLFQTGESTNFLVLTRQNELLDSKRRSVLATLDFNRSLSRLQQAIGATLEWYGIRLK